MYISYLVQFSIEFSFSLRATFRDRRPQPYGTKRQFEVEDVFLRNILIINFERSLEIF